MKLEKTPNETDLHWSDFEEAGAFWGLKFLATIYRIFGRLICQIVMFPVLIFFYLILHQQRSAILQFYAQIASERPNVSVNFWSGFANFLNFGTAALDKVAAWNGSINPEQVVTTGGIDNLFELDPEEKGALLFVSHLGNVEVIRAVAGLRFDRTINVLVHTKHASKFNNILKKFNPKSQLKLIEVTEVNPAVALDLKNRIDRGEWVVIAADRPPVNNRHNVVEVPFLGREAPFAMGPYIMAHVLECPVYAVACLLKSGRYHVEWDKIADRIKLPRRNREEEIGKWANLYAQWLASKALQYPEQWYNFFSFWSLPEELKNET